jgi:hypothetical protein
MFEELERERGCVQGNWTSNHLEAQRQGLNTDNVG